MPSDHFRPRVGRSGHDSLLSKKPQTPMNSTKLNRKATMFDLRIEILQGRHTYISHQIESLKG
jgi:hypothetical protein